MDAKGVLKELEWQTKTNTVKKKVMLWLIPAVFGMMKKGSPYVNLLHSAAQFVGDPFNYVEHQEDYIGFVGDRIRWENPQAAVISDDTWVWIAVEVTQEVHKLAVFFEEPTNIGKNHMKAVGDTVVEVDTPMLLLIPAGLVEWLASARRTPWDLHKQIQKTVTNAGHQVTPESAKIDPHIDG